LALVQYFLTKFSLRHATLAWLVIFIPAAVNLFRGPHDPWVLIFLKTFLLRHATVAWRDTFLQAATDFLPDPRFSRVLSFHFWRRSAARFWTLRHFLGSPTGISAAFSLGIS
jgi:hypothetical protein